MKVTHLEKKKRLYQMTLDNRKSLYITEDTIVRFFLSKGKDITEEEFKEIRSYASFSYGKNLALYYLSFKQRTRKEINDYLLEHDIQPDSVQKILQHLEEENWINDVQYARQIISQNQQTGKKGPRIIQDILRRKGISQELISQASEETSYLEPAIRLAQSIAKKYEKRLTQRALLDKIKQQMYSKGFTSSQTQEAIHSIEFTEQDNLEQELLQKEYEKQLRKYQRKYDGYELDQKLIQALYRKGFSYEQAKDQVKNG